MAAVTTMHAVSGLSAAALTVYGTVCAPRSHIRAARGAPCEFCRVVAPSAKAAALLRAHRASFRPRVKLANSKGITLI